MTNDTQYYWKHDLNRLWYFSIFNLGCDGEVNTFSFILSNTDNYAHGYHGH